MRIEAGTEESTETMGTDTTADDATEASPAEVALSAQSRDPKVVTIPTQAMTRIKQAEREKGKKLAHQEFDARVKALGYDSWEALETAAAAKVSAMASTPPLATPPESNVAPQQTESRQPPTQSPPDHDVERRDLQRALEQSVEEKRQLNKQRASEEKLRKSLEKQLDAQQAEHTLRLAAAKAGVQDIDYAMHLLKNKLANKSESALEGFDEDAFFSKDLRASHPYLYGVETRPASTSAQSEPTPAPAKTRQVEAVAKENDARKLSREEFDARLRKMGLSRPELGMIS